MLTDYVESYERPDGYTGHTCVIHVCKDSLDKYFAVWLCDDGSSAYFTLADSQKEYEGRKQNAIRFI